MRLVGKFSAIVSRAEAPSVRHRARSPRQSNDAVRELVHAVDDVAVDAVNDRRRLRASPIRYDRETVGHRFGDLHLLAGPRKERADREGRTRVERIKIHDGPMHSYAVLGNPLDERAPERVECEVGNRCPHRRQHVPRKPQQPLSVERVGTAHEDRRRVIGVVEVDDVHRHGNVMNLRVVRARADLLGLGRADGEDVRVAVVDLELMVQAPRDRVKERFGEHLVGHVGRRERRLQPEYGRELAPHRLRDRHEVVVVDQRADRAEARGAGRARRTWHRRRAGRPGQRTLPGGGTTGGTRAG